MKDKYHVFCGRIKNLPVFSQDWWLDSVCGDHNWDVILVERGDEIVAAFPYFIREDKGMKCITMPPMTQKMGIFICYPDGLSVYKKLTYEKDIMKEVISKLPDYDFFEVNFDYRYQNWLPFYWSGFKQTTGYTYVIEDISDVDAVYNGFEYSKKKNIKKAQEEVEVLFDLSSVAFYENHKLTLKKQGAQISYSYDLFKKIYDESYKRGQGRTIYCIDKSGNIHAALFVIWDDFSAYDLISTIDPEFRNSGGATLLIYEMMKLLSKNVKVFDFEGSMIEGVEGSFRKFGTIQKSYFKIMKRNSRRAVILKGIKDMINGL